MSSHRIHRLGRLITAARARLVPFSRIARRFQRLIIDDGLENLEIFVSRCGKRFAKFIPDD